MSSFVELNEPSCHTKRRTFRPRASLAVSTTCHAMRPRRVIPCNCVTSELARTHFQSAAGVRYRRSPTVDGRRPARGAKSASVSLHRRTQRSFLCLPRSSREAFVRRRACTCAHRRRKVARVSPWLPTVSHSNPFDVPASLSNNRFEPLDLPNGLSSVSMGRRPGSTDDSFRFRKGRVFGFDTWEVHVDVCRRRPWRRLWRTRLRPLRRGKGRSRGTGDVSRR